MRIFTLSSLLIAGMLSATAKVSDLPSNPPVDLMLTPPTSTAPTTLVKSGLGLIRTGEALDAIPSDGSLTRAVLDGDKMYLSRIFSWNDAPGWIEGTIKDNTVTFKFPQPVNRTNEDVNGIIQVRNFYAVVCELTYFSSTSADMIPTADQTMTFTLNPDGSLTPENPDLFLGNWEYADYVWNWNMDGDYYYSLTPQEAVATTLPEGIEMTPMILTYPHVLYGGAYADEVKVGFKDDDCYIQGIAIGISDLPDATIKGKLLNNGVVTFDSGQFLGNSWLYGFTQYFLGGETSYITDSQIDGGYRPVFSPTENFEFVYDSSARTLTSDMSFIIVPAPQDDPEDLYYENIYNFPEIFYADPEGAVQSLVTPELISFIPADEYYPNVIEFAVSMLSGENRILDMDKLYFEIYTDGHPFEFTPAMDSSLKAPASLIPFGSNDYKCFVTQEEIIQLVALPAADFSSLSVRLVYDPESGNPVYSDFLNILGSGIEEVITDDAGVTTGYFDLQGRPVTHPAEGLFIRATKMQDGTLRHDKVMMGK